MNLPSNFIHNIRNSFGEAGKTWLENLPALLEQASRRWDLTPGEPLLLSYNYVCAARINDDRRKREGWPSGDVVLKMGVPNRELLSELHALRLFHGQGAVRLLDADDDNYMFILERLYPGQMLATLADDDLRTQIICDVMERIHQPVPANLLDTAPWNRFIRLSEWVEPLYYIRSERFGGTTGPFPVWLVEHVESLLPELFASPEGFHLLHGDLHHFNILSSGDAWMLIDPKGVLGPRGYECGPLLINPIPDFPYLPDAVRQTARRIAILSERMGLPHETIRDWGLCHSLLSAYWDLADDNSGAEYSLACAAVIAAALNP